MREWDVFQVLKGNMPIMSTIPSQDILQKWRRNKDILKRGEKWKASTTVVPALQMCLWKSYIQIWKTVIKMKSQESVKPTRRCTEEKLKIIKMSQYSVYTATCRARVCPHSDTNISPPPRTNHLGLGLCLPRLLQPHTFLGLNSFPPILKMNNNKTREEIFNKYQ